ncbi:MAG: sigma-70 family RNA polymerase sigma factor [Bacilli bacterium]|nr:sigma-70 family RNA polymerase sigma factor [Bacilli bacterium]
MFDVKKYKGQINRLINFSEQFQYVTQSFIYEVFESENNEIIDEVIKYLKSVNIDVINDFTDEIEPSDEELLKVYSSEVLEEIDLVNDNININDLIKTYLNDIGKIPLLDYQQEIKCAKDIQAGSKAEKELANNKMLSKEEKKTLKKITFIGLEARQLLIESNLRLVVSIAKKYINRGLTFMDLVQEGNIGLIKAVYKYDPSRGFRFSTYGTWWIRQAISRAIADKGRMVRLPVHMTDVINRVLKEKTLLTQKLQKEPTNEELAESLGMSLERLEYIYQVSQDVVSLDSNIDNEEETFLVDVIPDITAVNPVAYLENLEYRNKIDKMLKTLTPREERIIKLRYGLEDNTIHTLEDIAKEFGITRERVRQLEVKAIRRLRHPSRLKIIK